MLGNKVATGEPVSIDSTIKWCDKPLSVRLEESTVEFESEDTDFKWDGTNFNGDKLPAGNYIYYVTANDSDGKPLTKYSALTIKY
jgi:flagellar hook assembly protein FlgD